MKEIDNILKNLTPESNPKASDMTLLDYFAGQAIQHLGTHGMMPNNIGEKCYQIAALMLEERERIKQMQAEPKHNFKVGDYVTNKMHYEGQVKAIGGDTIYVHIYGFDKTYKYHHTELKPYPNPNLNP